MNLTRSQELFAEAQTLLPGGVDSPVRAFRAEGAYLIDVDGNRFVDYVLSWGPLILGHAHPRVVQALSAAAARGTSYGAPNPLEVEQGVYLAPSQFEAGFMSRAHGEEEINATIEAARNAFRRSRVEAYQRVRDRDTCPATRRSAGRELERHLRAIGRMRLSRATSGRA